MNNPSEPLGLRSPDGREAQLLSVQIQGELLGLMLRLTVRQTWRNTSGAPMATRLTFALAPEQHLLDVQTEHDGELQPVCSDWRPGQRLSHATPGTLHTGQQVTMQWRVAQLLHLDGGSLRLQLPASLAPTALRPARISIELHDALAQGTLSSSSHEWQKVRHANGLTLRLLAPHGLDKDMCLSVHGLRDMAFAVASPNPSQPGTGTLLASRSLTLGGTRTTPRLRIKLLVDHSGAISGERQSKIQMALESLLAGLQAEDQLSCSRVDQTLVHDLPRLQACTEAYVRRARALMRHPEILPGQPDWASVLQAMVDLPDEDEEPVQDASIVLITGQPLMGAERLLPSLLASGHRLHVMTVGEAASQSDWSRLARLSDGSCEALGAGQHCLQTLQRLLDRMRRLRPVQAQVSLQGHPLDTVQQEHAFMAEGDTLHLWARFSCAQTPADLTDLTGRPQWLASLAWQATDIPSPPYSPPQMPVLWEAQGDLHRLCSAHLTQPVTPLPASAPAARPVHTPAQRVISDETPEASVAGLSTAPGVVTEPGQAKAQDTDLDGRPRRPAMATDLARQSAPGSAAPPHPMAHLVQQFNQQAKGYRLFRAALAATLPRVPARQLDGLILQLSRRAGSPARVWAMLLHWLHTEQSLALQAHALALVENELASLPVALRSEVHAALAVTMAAPALREAA